MSRTVLFGIDRVARDRLPLLEGRRLGLLANQASVDRELRSAWDVLAELFPGQLAAVFSPQHGLWGEQQANMIESPHSVLAHLGVPVYSLYSETRTPTDAMLDSVDCMVVDLQDVGCRVYTFLWTMTHCLRACAQAGCPVVVLDRPNPLGRGCEGPVLQDHLRSFVGLAPLPLRHDLTIGEVARFVNRTLDINAELVVVEMEGWHREMTWPELHCQWIPPSPNLPTWDSAAVYPGQVLLEGTNLSEGRGTTCPFRILGAPWIDGNRLAARFAETGLRGVALRPMRFVPMFDKFAGQSCGGVFLHPGEGYRPVSTAVGLIACIAELWPDDFGWLDPPYEYETEKSPIDILYGNDQLRRGCADSTTTLRALWRHLSADEEVRAFGEAVRPHLIYDDSR